MKRGREKGKEGTKEGSSEGGRKGGKEKKTKEQTGRPRSFPTERENTSQIGVMRKVKKFHSQQLGITGIISVLILQ